MKPRIVIPGNVIDRPLQVEDAEIIEAIVRDCAKASRRLYGDTPNAQRAEIAILARYGLEPK